MTHNGQDGVESYPWGSQISTRLCQDTEYQESLPDGFAPIWWPFIPIHQVNRIYLKSMPKLNHEISHSFNYH